ncbi:8-oxoguanine DNA glycosylase OGG fold protein [Streptomyces albiflavescens]|uniref:8-oxoguanine DNA glycosylase OGG fold protein n=1 Tax=Streptomyces albiflavescens TaxID=1623582 RepID=UPI003570DCE0
MGLWLGPAFFTKLLCFLDLATEAPAAPRTLSLGQRVARVVCTQATRVGLDVGLTSAAGAAAWTSSNGGRTLHRHGSMFDGTPQERLVSGPGLARQGLGQAEPGDFPPVIPGFRLAAVAAPYHGPSHVVVRPYPRRPRLCRSLMADAGTVDVPRTTYGGVRDRTVGLVMAVLDA